MFCTAPAFPGMDPRAEDHVDALHVRVGIQITVHSEDGVGGPEIFPSRRLLPAVYPSRKKRIKSPLLGLSRPISGRLLAGEDPLDRRLARRPTRPAGEQVAQPGEEVLVAGHHVQVGHAAGADGVDGRPVRQDVPSLGIHGEQSLLPQQAVSVDLGVGRRHAVVAHHGHHRRPQVERREHPGELAVHRLPDPPPRRRQRVAALGRVARLARIGQQELVPGLVDDRHVAHQQVPVGAPRGGDQAVAEETGEALGLLDPGIEVDAGAALPRYRRAAGRPADRARRAPGRRGRRRSRPGRP